MMVAISPALVAFVQIVLALLILYACAYLCTVVRSIGSDQTQTYAGRQQKPTVRRK